jgi:hypothetical protein
VWVLTETDRRRKKIYRRRSNFLMNVNEVIEYNLIQDERISYDYADLGRKFSIL